MTSIYYGYQTFSNAECTTGKQIQKKLTDNNRAVKNIPTVWVNARLQVSAFSTNCIKNSFQCNALLVNKYKKN